jgi:metallo-beta-lactamase family protein
MKLTFLGATGTVTGSKYLIEAGDRRILIDCGLFQGFKQLRLRNRAPLLIDPGRIDAVILSHAHIDHSGYLPVLIKNGFTGKVYCTPGTRDLCAIMLPDSGHLQEEEAEYANKHGYSKHHPALPLYTKKDGEQALARFAPVAFEQEIDLGDGLSFKLSPAGHILGAALVTVKNHGRTLVFSGDLGRPQDLIMYPPAVVRHADYLILESTYGDRRHEQTDPQVELAAIINRTVERRGVLLIPAFAVGRAQSLLYRIHLLKAGGAIGDIPVFLNSPMAAEATRVLQRHCGEHRLTPEQCGAMGDAARVIANMEESIWLAGQPGPAIIISASGMATGGRVLHHLKALAPDKRNTVLFVGFQASGTRGAAMLAGAQAVKIHGEYVPVRAEVAILNNLSAHADYTETLEWLRHFDAPPRQTFLVHGEPPAADALRLRIEEQLHWQIYLPEYKECVDLS